MELSKAERSLEADNVGDVTLPFVNGGGGGGGTTRGGAGGGVGTLEPKIFIKISATCW